MAADRLEEILDGDVAAPKPPRLDRAAVEDEPRDIEAQESHRPARNRLVAAHQDDERVEHVAAAEELDRVGDHLAADERGLHPLRPHGDAVADGDRVELHRSPAGAPHPLLHVLGQTAEVEVAGHRLGPGVGDADDRPGDVVVGEPDRLEIGARGSALRAIVERAAAVTGVERHGAPC